MRLGPGAGPPSISAVFGLDAFYLGHFGRVPVYLRFDILFLFVLVLSYPMSMVSRIILLAVILFSILMHEMGHAMVATAKGMGGVSVVITGLGGYCSYQGMPSNGQKLAISVAGPLMNFTIAGFAWLALRYLPLNNELVYEFVRYLWYINLFLGILNSMPIYPLDGGQSLLALLQFKLRPGKAGSIVLGTSVISAIVVLGVLTWLNGGQPPLLMAGILIFGLFQAFRDLR